MEHQEDIVPLISTYKELYMESRAIQKEVQLFRKRFQTRTKEIRKQMMQLEKQLLQYMKDNDHPGLRFQELVLLPVMKPNRRKGDSQSVLQSFLQKHELSPEARQDLLRVISGNTNTDDENNKVLKVKLWNPKVQSVDK